MIHPIVKLLSDAVIPHPKPVVYISGGLDSTILLHHLWEKTDEKIYTYTYGFFSDDNEFKDARKISEWYGTTHKEVLVDNFIHRLPKIQRHLKRPRFNVQIFWVIEQAHKDGRETCYLGEGLDEHFGGYWYKPHLSYVEAWSDHFQYIRPTHLELHDVFGLRCEIPFTYLDFRKTLPYWDPQREKGDLRKIYERIIPKCAIDKRKRSGAPTWKRLWTQYLSEIYPNIKPKSDNEIRWYLNKYTIGVWHRVNEHHILDSERNT